jgi:hypothetical protein
VLGPSAALKRRNGYSDKGTSTCASLKSPPLVSSLVGWLVGWLVGSQAVFSSLSLLQSKSKSSLAPATAQPNQRNAATSSI